MDQKERIKHFEICRIHPEKDDLHIFYYCLYEWKYKKTCERERIALYENGRLQPILEYCFMHGISSDNCSLTKELSYPKDRTVRTPAIFHLNLNYED